MDEPGCPLGLLRVPPWSCFFVTEQETRMEFELIESNQSTFQARFETESIPIPVISKKAT
jgi:hypothetical protein